MSKESTTLEKLQSKPALASFERLYTKNGIDAGRRRYAELAKTAIELFGEGDYSFFSSPGRTELAGNHTDHNHGCVLAGSIQLDAVACVKPSGDNRVMLHSEGFAEPFSVDLSDLSVQKNEENSTLALIRGVAKGLSDRGYSVGGFSGVMNSNVLQGSGLSSSASIEVLIALIFSELFNKGKALWVELAQVGQYAENVFFGKPCGLMDQMACASGGIVAIDFEDPKKPSYKRVEFDFSKHGYTLAVVNTGGSHADLTSDYAAIPEEMKSVAALFGKASLRGIELDDLLERASEIRTKTSDRALLRAIHFVNENERVGKMVELLKEKKLEKFLKKVKKSGDSSWRLLQNITPTKNPLEQGVALAIAVTQEFLKKTGVVRVHGGGFAGTIQVYLPTEHLSEYEKRMNALFGAGCVTPLRIRADGAVRVV